jgi:hypothetical protein
LYCGFDCFSKTNDLSTMVRKRPKKRGLPSQEVPPQRWRESPRRSGSSVQDNSDDRLLPTFPSPVNEGILDNIQVSHDQSLDSQGNNDVASDSVVPDLRADHLENCKCDWSHIFPCNFPQLKPLNCTVNGCNKLVHHLYQIAFEEREGCAEIIALKCCLHHPQSPLRASKSKPPPVNDSEASSSSDESSSSDDSKMVQVQHQHYLVEKIYQFNQGLGKANSYSQWYLQPMILLRNRVMMIRIMHDQQQHQLVGKI